MIGAVGFVVGWLIVAVIFAGPPLAVAVIVWHIVTRARRAHRRYSASPRQPYDDAYQRAVWEVAAENGRRAALEDLRALSLRVDH